MTTAKLRVKLNTGRRYRGQGHGFGFLAAHLEDEVEGLAKEYADRVAELAQELAPFRSGRLKSSIKSRKIGNHRWVAYAGAPYAAYVEYGTRGRHAKPYFTPAVRIAKEEHRIKHRRIFRRF